MDRKNEVIGELIDTCNNLLAAATLRVSDHIHIEGLRGGIEKIKSTLLTIYDQG